MRWPALLVTLVALPAQAAPPGLPSRDASRAAKLYIAAVRDHDLIEYSRLFAPGAVVRPSWHEPPITFSEWRKRVEVDFARPIYSDVTLSLVGGVSWGATSESFVLTEKVTMCGPPAIDCYPVYVVERLSIASGLITSIDRSDFLTQSLDPETLLPPGW